VGEQFALQARDLPPPAGLRPPSRWGTQTGIAELFGKRLTGVDLTTPDFHFVLPTTRALFELFRDWFGPVATVLGAVDEEQAGAFTRDWLELSERHNVATDGTCDIPSPYLQVVATRVG
jgi:hypothetical protein